jgi:hypothetical protein
MLDGMNVIRGILTAIGLVVVWLFGLWVISLRRKRPRRTPRR